MRTLVILVVIYLVFKALVKMLGNMKILDPQDTPVEKKKTESQSRLHVNEADIEDADFKDVD